VSTAVVEELKEIASDPDSRHVFQVDDFQAIERIRESLRRIICVGMWCYRQVNGKQKILPNSLFQI